MAEELVPEQRRQIGDLLDDWREAERDADATRPETAARTMARQRADLARDEFHEAEDAERARQGDETPRRAPELAPELRPEAASG